MSMLYYYTKFCLPRKTGIKALQHFNPGFKTFYALNNSAIRQHTAQTYQIGKFKLTAEIMNWKMK